MISEQETTRDDARAVDPIGDQERLGQQHAGGRNFAKVGSSRASTLTYTYGPGAIMDLSHFTVMPTGLDDWDRVYARRAAGEGSAIHAPRLVRTAQLLVGPQVSRLRPYPWEPSLGGDKRDNVDLGVPARVFPQWLRCTGCDRLAPLSFFVRDGHGYRNTNPYRPDQATIYHYNCPGHGGRARSGKAREAACVPARYLLACPDGHLDEFPYDWFVHHGGNCPKAAHPILKLIESARSSSGTAVKCVSCGEYRPMSHAISTEGRDQLPRCRGRMPHLGVFRPGGCDEAVRVMLIGASNLWFPINQSIIDMPQRDENAIRKKHYDQVCEAFRDTPGFIKDPADTLALQTAVIILQKHRELQHEQWVRELDASALAALIAQFTAGEEDEAARAERRRNWDPVELLVPEWRHLDEERFSATPGDSYDQESGLSVHTEDVDETVRALGVRRVLGIDRLRKINALLGFTRIDAYDRADNLGARFVPLSRKPPTWLPATEDRGEGVFIQFDEEAIQQWESRVEDSELWEAYRAAHERNAINRQSDTSKGGNTDERMPPARYWMLHTLAHALIKRMAMSSGYGVPSLSERLYAWKPDGERQGAAGLMIVTAASDSDGTLGGLVALAEPARFAQIMADALDEMRRCSSDPVCAMRVPEDPEDFLHGAACHSCVMVSETSCERSNRFLDRRFLVALPGGYKRHRYADLAFFG